MRMHSTRIGAAFGASIILSAISAFDTAAAEKSPAPLYACFDAGRAGAIGALGAASGEARSAFEAGSCLALPAGTDVTASSRDGNMRRIAVAPDAPALYVMDAAQGESFARYLPVTAALLERGRALMRCGADSAQGCAPRA